jgi:hypothetical protein
MPPVLHIEEPRNYGVVHGDAAVEDGALEPKFDKPNSCTAVQRYNKNIARLTHTRWRGLMKAYDVSLVAAAARTIYYGRRSRLIYVQSSR